MTLFDSLIIMAASILLAGFFSGSETALISCSKVKLRSRAKLGSWRASILERLIQDPEKFFSIVLVGTNISVIICTATATALAVSRFGDSGPLIATIVITPLILIFGEVIPKSIYLDHADRFSIIVAPFLKALTFILWPVIMPVTLFARLMTGRLKESEKGSYIISTREELIYLYRRGNASEEVKKRETEMIDKVFRFGMIKASDLMVPASEVISFPVTASIDEVVEEANRHPYTRYPLTSPDDGSIVGVISLFDLLGLDGGESLEMVMHEPFFVDSDIFAKRLLLTLKNNPDHFAIVTDNGRTAGIITLENILENIVGDIAT
ncbi:MAG: HlyC/CorC family transporter [Candidatus Krumholzibacteriota bacterium]|nr:HlyC/CorC family transporter [Candidatus Krumholzibacteriota bacterium]